MYKNNILIFLASITLLYINDNLHAADAGRKESDTSDSSIEYCKVKKQAERYRKTFELVIESDLNQYTDFKGEHIRTCLRESRIFPDDTIPDPVHSLENVKELLIQYERHLRTHEDNEMYTRKMMPILRAFSGELGNIVKAMLWRAESSSSDSEDAQYACPLCLKKDTELAEEGLESDKRWVICNLAGCNALLCTKCLPGYQESQFGNKCLGCQREGYEPHAFTPKKKVIPAGSGSGGAGAGGSGAGSST